MNHKVLTKLNNIPWTIEFIKAVKSAVLTRTFPSIVAEFKELFTVTNDSLFAGDLQVVADVNRSKQLDKIVTESKVRGRDRFFVLVIKKYIGISRRFTHEYLRNLNPWTIGIVSMVKLKSHGYQYVLCCIVKSGLMYTVAMKDRDPGSINMARKKLNTKLKMKASSVKYGVIPELGILRKLLISHGTDWIRNVQKCTKQVNNTK